uniref:Uncharacterized protein n=1 Tax=Ditylenchus dipsaci TaxID=166011 RepID=A0A915E089_9BILA
MLYSGFPYPTPAPQSISNTSPTLQLHSPTSQQLANTILSGVLPPPPASVNPHLIYPAQTPVLFPTYNSDSPWTTAQQLPQPSPKPDLKQDDVGNTRKHSGSVSHPGG